MHMPPSAMVDPPKILSRSKKTPTPPQKPPSPQPEKIDVAKIPRDGTNVKITVNGQQYEVGIFYFVPLRLLFISLRLLPDCRVNVLLISPYYVIDSICNKCAFD